MTLFAGALLRTIEFVMVTTDARFPGPQELGSRADDAHGSQGRGAGVGWGLGRGQSKSQTLTCPWRGGRSGRLDLGTGRVMDMVKNLRIAFPLLDWPFLVTVIDILYCLTSACGSSGLAGCRLDINFWFVAPFAIRHPFI